MQWRHRANVRIDSAVCRVGDLVVQYAVGDAVRDRLVLDEPWPRRWSATWRFDWDEVAWPVRDLSAVPLLSAADLHPCG